MLFLASCGGGPNPDEQALNAIPSTQSVNGEKFEILSLPDGLTFGDGALSGSGFVKLAKNLGSKASSYNFELSLSLDNGGELTFFSHASESLASGVEVKFRRNAALLSVTVTAAGITEDWSSFFTSINAANEMKLAIDVHNDEPLTHLIFWNDLTNTELLNSAEDVDGCPGKGVGQHWGLKLVNATVSSIQKGESRDAH